MEDLFTLTNDQLYARMIEYIQARKCKEALLLWGLVRFDSIDEKRYYLASIFVIQNKYEEAIFYLKTITDKEIKKAGELSVLDALAKQGNAHGFLKFYANDFEGTIGNIALFNYLYDIIFYSEAYKFVDFGAYDEIIDEIARVNKTTENDKPEELDAYLLRTYQMMSLYIEAIKEAIEVDQENSMEATTRTIAKAHGLYSMVEALCPPYAEAYPIGRFFDNYEESVDIFIEDMKRHIIEMDDNNIKKWMVYFAILDRVASDEMLVSEISNSIELYAKLLKHHNQEIIYPLLSAYSKAISVDFYAYNKIENILSNYGVSPQTLANATIYESVLSGLSNSSQIAYKSACTLYSLAKMNDYENKDAGPISLAFYRILEKESNIIIWKPILEKLSLKSIKREYSKLNKEGQERWRILKNIFVGMLTDDNKPELMLGNLRILMEMISNPKDELARMLRTEFIDRLTEDGKVAYKNGKIDNWYSIENTSKFRNPPAHAKYLHFDVAERCKEFVEEQLINMSKWIAPSRPEDDEHNDR